MAEIKIDGKRSKVIKDGSVIEQRISGIERAVDTRDRVVERNRALQEALE